jgi:ArsR family transcriptional regulator, arsenate/arsenite/antimonite-responsive transcriptional repressor
MLRARTSTLINFFTHPASASRAWSTIDAHLFHGTISSMPKPLPLLDPRPSAAACCTPLAASPLSAADAQVLAARLKALADPARLRLLSMLMASENKELCTCDLTDPLGLSQPTVSHHFKVLAAAGLVVGERRGTWTWYRVVPQALTGIAQVLDPA